MKSILSVSLACLCIIMSCEGLLGQNKASVKTAPTRFLKTTQGGKVIAPVIDIFPQITSGVYDNARIANEIKLFKEMGFERIYFVVCNPGFPSFSSPRFSVMPVNNNAANNAAENIRRLGDPNLAYLSEAKRQGLQAWAIYKPYEGGSGQTIPHKAIAPSSPSQIETIGGQLVYFDSLLSNKPEWRVKRKDLADSILIKMKTPVTRLEIAFRLDSLKDRSGRNSYLNFGGIPDSKMKTPKLKLWLSSDNGKYVAYKGDMHVDSKIETRKTRDANGYIIDNRAHRYLVMSISFEMEQSRFTNKNFKYFALTIDDRQQELYTLPHSMIRAFTSFGEVPVTTAIHARSSAVKDEKLSSKNRKWGMEKSPVTGEDARRSFEHMGFEFEWHGSGHWGQGWSDSPVYGIAIGKRKYMKGTPCEAYQEVRDYWLGNIKKLLVMGFDGVDIRLQNHSGMVADYANYGCNKPIVDRYKQKFGVDILKQSADPLKIMEIRGDFFLLFLQEASKMTHQLNKKLQIHLKRAYINPVLGNDWHDLGAWHMPKILLNWKKAIDLVDEVTIKDYYLNRYQPQLGKDIKEYAKQQHKRLWIHAYFSQGGELNEKYFSAVEADPYVGGILLYEANGTFLKTSGNTGSYILPNVEKMLSILNKIGFGKSHNVSVSKNSTTANKPKIIFDTDMGPDYDDIGAITMLHALADRGECEILATVSCDQHPSIAPTIEVYNRYFNRKDLPIGIPDDAAPNFTASNNWNDMIINEYAPALKNKSYPTAVSVYRKILAAQPDNSVTVLTVGFLSNISELLNSKADEYSSLNGMELVKLKVKQLVSMAGVFPEGSEFNVNKHPSASVEVFSKWPKPILFSGYEIGSRIFTGGRVANQKNSNPVQRGYAYNLRTYQSKPAPSRPSWDQTAVLIAVRDPENYFYVSKPGKFIINTDGSNRWDPDVDAGHRFIIHKYPYELVGKVIEDLMLHQSKR